MIYSSTILNTENGDFKVNYHEFKAGDCLTLVKGEVDSNTPIRIVTSILEHFAELVPHLDKLAKREGGRNRAKLQQSAELLPVATKLAQDLSASEDDATPQ